MLKNYLKIAVRNLLKYRTNSLVSITGLSIGIGCFLLLATYILHEWRYDRFHYRVGDLVRVNLFYQSGDGESVNVAVTPTAVAPVFSREFEEVESAVRLYALSGNGAVPVRYEDKLFNEKAVLFADSTFFNMFSFPFVEGNPATALSAPNSVVIDETTARKFFGNESAIGKSVSVDNRYAMQVTGVVADVPSYSSIKFHWLGSYSTLPRSRTESFDSANDFTYLLLKKGSSLPSLRSKVDSYVAKNLNDPQNPAVKVRLDLEEFGKIHLYSTVTGGMETTGNYKYMYILSAVACLILAIACINFVNLVTARSVVRAKEVGVRKVMGAERSQVFKQYLYECGIITVMSVLVGFVIAMLCFSGLSGLTASELNLGVWPPFTVAILLVLLCIVVTILAGAYPATVLSGFEPIKVLKGNMLSASGGNLLRSSLVVFQFSVSILFIIGTLVANTQLRYIQNKNLGLNPDQVLVLDLSTGISSEKLAAIKNNLLSNTAIKSVTASYDSPLNVQGGYSISSRDKPNDFSMNITAIPVEKDFVTTMGMKLLVGENFNDSDILQATLDSVALRNYAFIFNESAVKAMGWSAREAIGKNVNMNGREGIVKAVVKDFHFRSMHEKIAPIAIIPEYSFFGKVMLKVEGANVNQAVDAVKKSWEANFSMQPFEHHFLNDEFNDMYQAESRVSTVLTIFSVITILISCLGLFALIAFITHQRTKEIGIRKVLGATATSVVVLLSKEFVKLTVIAILIASPIAWYLMNQWLQDFAYRIEISWGVFVMAGFMAIAIAMFTVSFQAIRAALLDPVKSLRSE
jgi:putative ABC transport system permease protein